MSLIEKYWNKKLIIDFKHNHENNNFIKRRTNLAELREKMKEAGFIFQYDEFYFGNKISFVYEIMYLDENYLKHFPFSKQLNQARDLAYKLNFNITWSVEKCEPDPKTLDRLKVDTLLKIEELLQKG